MKALFRTSVIMVVATAVLALSTSIALAAPGDGYYPGQPTQIDPAVAAQLLSMVESGQLQLDGAVPPLGDEDYIVPPDDLDDDSQVPADEGEGVIPCDPADEACEDGQDNPGLDGNPEDLGNPEIPTPSATDQPPAATVTPRTPSSSLPNTGTHLLIIAGLGLSMAVAALAVRRYAVRRSR